MSFRVSVGSFSSQIILHTVIILIFQKVYFHQKVPENIFSYCSILDLRNWKPERWFSQGTQLLHELEPRSSNSQQKRYTFLRHRHWKAVKKTEEMWWGSRSQETWVTTQGNRKKLTKNCEYCSSKVSIGD